MSAPLPDAAPANWVDRHAPAGIRPWLKLARLDRPTGIWLLMLPGWQGLSLAAARAHRWPDPTLLALFALGSALMRAAGCAFNDIVDKDVDAKVARTAARPIASGQISVAGAGLFILACLAGSLAILLTLNRVSVMLGIASLALVAAYPFMKRITWWPQAWLGLTFNWGTLMGYAAASAVLAASVSWAAVLLYLAGVFWTLGYDTIYAIQDLEDDALVGVKSSARRLGAAAPRAVLIFYGVSVGSALAAWWAGGLGPWFLPFAAFFAAHLAWQASRVKVADSAGALKLFRSNAVAGAILAVALVAGHW